MKRPLRLLTGLVLLLMIAAIVVPLALPLHSLALSSAWLEEGRSGGPRSQDAALDATRVFTATLVVAAGLDGTSEEARAAANRAAAVLVGCGCP